MQFGGAGAARRDPLAQFTGLGQIGEELRAALAALALGVGYHGRLTRGGRVTGRDDTLGRIRCSRAVVRIFAAVPAVSHGSTPFALVGPLGGYVRRGSWTVTRQYPRITESNVLPIKAFDRAIGGVPRP
ncbi:MAG: hypothetical protein ACRDVE_18990 [Actinocrinis sp.]